MIGIIENYQQEDGSVEVPAPLRKFMGGIDRITA
jgi:seryl-tRNA synthetase